MPDSSPPRPAPGAPSSPAEVVVVVEVERPVAGGVGLGHLADGRVALVEGGLPGDVVRVEVTDERSTLLRGRVAEVRTPAPSRSEPPCPEVARGCGGCDLQHARHDAQVELKVAVVRDALRRLGGHGALPVTTGDALAATGYRTTVRAAVVDGRAGFHRRRSEQVLAVDDCLVAHPSISELLSVGRFGDAAEVVLRVGARTGERMAVVDPTADDTELPEDVRVIGGAELAEGRRAWIHEEVAGRRLRISARSFFQSGPEGAEALIAAVERAVGGVGPDDRLVDLYGGVGLFAAALGAGPVVLVERSPSAVADARVNLAHVDATVLRLPVEKWRPARADVVIADPARSGLGRAGVAAVVGTGAERVALVSCDPAALARDVGLLTDAGYEALGVELVDLFPHT
ncbi:MAG: class I SAM-dependent RNA methyltransferase, partial [Microthrixaceae bacterium]